MPISTMLRVRRLLAAILSCALASTIGVAATSAPAGAQAEDTVWLCQPGMADNPCELDRTATILDADGSETVEQEKPARKQRIDCFYVYPTVSGQQTTNADRTKDPEVVAVAEQQASRFSEVCRVFAPVYRQITIAGLFNSTNVEDVELARKTAYDDVLNAWNDYLANYNNGRGVVLIGHSQGSGMLSALIKNELDNTPAQRKRLVSALLIGGQVVVPKGEDVGGSFEHVRACATASQTGCVVAYNSFDATPPADALFGSVRLDTAGVLGGAGGDDLEVLCVNPADLSRVGGGNGGLVSYFRTEQFPGTLGAVQPSDFDQTTPWVQIPKLYAASCASEGDSNWLQVDHAVGDPRPGVRAALGADWGLHLVDVNIALGNLVDLVRQQSKAYAKK